MEINMKRIILVFTVTILASQCSNSKNLNNCINIVENLKNAKNIADSYSDRKIDLENKFKEINGYVEQDLQYLILSKSNLKIPYYLNNNDVLINESDKLSFKFKNDETQVFGSIFLLADVNTLKNDDIKYLPKDLMKIDGYLNAVKSVNNYELYELMFSSDLTISDCKDNKNLGEFAHIANSKLQTSVSNIDWFKFSNSNYKYIINLDKIENSINMKVYSPNKLIELKIYYNNPIDIDNFNNWLYTISKS
jgi:hypothetical protein